MGGWLHTVAVRRSQNLRREAAVRKRYEQIQQPTTAFSAEAEWDEIAPLLHNALGGLPDKLRLPLVLLYLQGRTQQEVANELSVSQATVSRRAREGIEKLRSALKQMGICVTAAAMIGGLAAESQAAVPISLRESLGNLALSGIGPPPKPTPAQPGLSLSPVWPWLLGVTAVVGLSLIMWLAAMIRMDSIAPHPHTPGMSAGDDRDSQTPLVGGLTEAVRLAGRNVDYTQFMGDSSLAFVTRWYRVDAQPSVHHDAPWDSVGYLVYTGNKELRLLEKSLGMSLRRHFVPPDFDAAEFVDLIATAINADEYPVGYLAVNRPQIGEGCSPAHVVVIIGADPVQERLLLRCDDRQRSTWHPAADLAPRVLIPRKNRDPLARRDALIAALHAAVRSWDSPPERSDDVVALCVHRDALVYSGWRAYDAWIKDLGQNITGTSGQSQHVRAVSQWSFSLQRRGRSQAAKYLRREARQFTGKQQRHLLIVAELYERLFEETSDDLFHLATPQITKSSGRRDGQRDTADNSLRMLELARQLDAMAIREIRTFLRIVPRPLRQVKSSAVSAAPKEVAMNEMAAYDDLP